MLPAEAGDDAVVGRNNRAGDFALGFLQLEDFLLDGVARNEAVREHMARLSDAVAAINRLGFHRGIPPRVQKEHVLGRGQIQSEPARFQTDEEQPAVLILLEALHAALAVARPAVEVFVRDLLLIEPLLEDSQQGCELREEEDFVSAFDHLRQLRQ